VKIKFSIQKKGTDFGCHGETPNEPKISNAQNQYPKSHISHVARIGCIVYFGFTCIHTPVGIVTVRTCFWLPVVIACRGGQTVPADVIAGGPSVWTNEVLCGHKSYGPVWRHRVMCCD
jgi:hypothetical protein